MTACCERCGSHVDLRKRVLCVTHDPLVDRPTLLCLECKRPESAPMHGPARGLDGHPFRPTTEHPHVEPVVRLAIARRPEE